MPRPAPALPTGPVPSPRRPRLVGPSLRRAVNRAGARATRLTGADVAVGAVFATIAALAVRPLVDPDVWWHLATGRRIVATHRIPKGDPFSWTAPGRRWIAHEWLSETAMYLLHRVGGAALLSAVFAAVITLAFALAHRTMRVLGASRPIAAASTLLAAAASFHTWGVRPQMLSLALTSGFVLALTHVVRTGRARPLWALPPLLVVWVNLHGGFVFGLALVGLFAGVETVTAWRWTGDRRRAAALWATFAACVVATLVGPNGIHGLTYPFSYLGDNASTRYIAEWQRPEWASPGWWPLAGLLALAAVALVAGARRRMVGLRDLALVAPFFVLAVQSQRNCGLFAVVAGPVVAALVSRLTAARAARTAQAGPTEAAGRPRFGVAFAGSPRVLAAVVAGAAAVVVVPGLASAGRADVLRPDFPVATATRLPAAARGHLLNCYDFGGYLIWHRPDVPVYVDGRPDMYGDAFMDGYMRLTFTRGDWRGELDRRGIRWAILQPTVPLARALRAEPGWRVVTRDEASVLFARR